MERFFRPGTKFLFVALVVLIFTSFLHSPGQAKPLTLVFEWQQELSPDLKGWNLYMSETSGTYAGEPILTIYYDGNPQNEYSSQTDIFSPDGEEHTYYFVLTAFDDATPDPNETAYSNEVSQVVDFDIPGIPFSFTVEIKPFP